MRLKVDIQLTKGENVYTFQFLSVRLKVAGEDYGSILEIPFQFLSVRLKVAVAPVINTAVAPFQFLSVRLKVLFALRFVFLIRHFNSFRCD